MSEKHLLNGSLSIIDLALSFTNLIAFFLYFVSSKGVSAIAHSPVDLLMAIHPPNFFLSASAYK